jgi:hypothetical protein
VDAGSRTALHDNVYSCIGTKNTTTAPCQVFQNTFKVVDNQLVCTFGGTDYPLVNSTVVAGVTTLRSGRGTAPTGGVRGHRNCDGQPDPGYGLPDFFRKSERSAKLHGCQQHHDHRSEFDLLELSVTGA